MSERLRFSPDILVRLGEELASDVDQGLIELVKNAYDADAVNCSVSLQNVETAGTIVVSDDGRGMTADTIRSGWLVIGRSGKQEKTLTPLYARVPAGDKGLGRLTALRLGRRVTIVTRPAETPGIEYTLELDWDAFDAADVVEEVPIELQSVATTKSPGTEIRIEQLKSPIGRGAMSKLARGLLLLADPFMDEHVSSRPLPSHNEHPDGINLRKDPGFRPTLDTKEFIDLQQKVRQSYFLDAEYRIQAILDDNGNATFRILDWKGDEVEKGAAERQYQAPPFQFDIWVFLLDNRSFSTRSSSISEVKAWLATFGGVHLYEDGVRVPPYGGAGDDWLGINLQRARSPEMRPSTNTAVGRVRVENTQRRLVQKTDRIGYIENQDFSELRACCQAAMNWAALVRTRERDQRQRVQRHEAGQKTEQAVVNLDRVLSKAVSATERHKVEAAIERYVKDAGHETKALRDELQLYRSLATAGMTSAVFSHEIGRPLGLIKNGLNALRGMVPNDLKDRAEKRITGILSAQTRLESFVSIPLTLLSKRKRRPGRTSVNSCLKDLLLLVEPVAKIFSVKIDLDLEDGYDFIHGSEAIIDGVVMNLIINSIKAFQRPGIEQAHRNIRIATRLEGANIVLLVVDNAGGIEGVSVNDIWLPGVTSDPDGTGFGLTIVRDSVSDLGGTCSVTACTDFGGAEFTIAFPLMRKLI